MDISGGGDRSDHSNGSLGASLSSIGLGEEIDELDPRWHARCARVSELPPVQLNSAALTPPHSPNAKKRSKMHDYRRRMLKVEEEADSNSESSDLSRDNNAPSSSHHSTNNSKSLGQDLEVEDLEEAREHDQLPDVEEYKASQGISTVDANKFVLKVTLFVALGIMVASILIALGVIIGRDQALLEEINGGGTADTDNANHGKGMDIFSDDANDYENSAASLKRLQDVIKLVTKNEWADSDLLEIEDTPENQAVRWLAQRDPMQLDPAVDGATAEFQNRFLLALFYYALDGPNWNEQLNFLSTKSVCEWNEDYRTKVQLPVTVGVQCHGMERVRELFLPNNNLRGPLPAKAMGHFLDLVDFNLFGNSISGILPESMRELRSLETVVLHDNELNGPMPDWLPNSWTNLKKLNLSHNRFIGGIPPNFGSRLGPTLETLALEKNMFSGTVEPLQGLINLKNLYLGDNRFSGELRDEILVSWTALEILDVSDNLLGGHLPMTLLAKDGLRVADLHGNNFSGPLPNLVEVEDSIEFLALQENQLTGPIDERLLSLNKLQHLDLSSNFFTGTFPKHLSQLTTLKYLFLAFNSEFKLGTIPTEFGRLTNLVDLSLQKTDRIGRIPTELSNLKKLNLLDLNSNLLDGTIPYQFGELTNLKFLLLKENSLTGSIPPQFEHLTELDTLLLDDNSLRGGASNVCGHEPASSLTTFVADCSEMGACECCTKCCADDDQSCNSVTWFSGLDPVAPGNYQRDSYLFHEDDIIYPVHVDGEQREQPHYYGNYSGYNQVVDESPIFDMQEFHPHAPPSSGYEGDAAGEINLPPDDFLDPGQHGVFDEDEVFGGNKDPDDEDAPEDAGIFDFTEFDPNHDGSP